MKVLSTLGDNMHIKICGITNKEDALLAIQNGAAALGFIFAESSPRKVTVQQVAEITAELPPFVSLVGVFLNHDMDFIQSTMKTCRLDIAQLHGDESPAFCEQLSCHVIKVFKVSSREDLVPIEPYLRLVSAILLDTKVAGLDGGTGQVFDWNLALDAKALGVPLILAGGINPDNVRDAIKNVQPYGLDVSSGVEKAVGKKDPKKLKQLFDNMLA